MSEFKREVKTYRVDYRCPKCNDGCMEPTGLAHEQYEHMCNNIQCQNTEWLARVYPAIEYHTIPTEVVTTRG